MANVFPFRAVQYQRGTGDLSPFIAPPYDVLDAAGKERLRARHPKNVVSIDLPHTPAKQLGPPEAYEGAAGAYRAWLSEGTLTRRNTPAMFAYRQTFDFGGKRYRRCGMACTVEAVPFGPRRGGGILPHEETFSGPKEDRFALMKATRAQLSPIFGLHADERGRANAIVHGAMEGRDPDATADMGDGISHEVWTIDDSATLREYSQALEGEDIFIADGHHRYTTGLNYIAQQEKLGPVGPDHPCRRSMMVLVGMSDPGLAIGPTHRVLGGMRGYTIEAFVEGARGVLEVREVESDLDRIEGAMAAARGENVLGLHDFASGRCFVAVPAHPDPLAARFPNKPRAWRTLDVALVQYVIVEGICRPKLNGGEDVRWAFPHSIPEVREIGKGGETGAGGGKGFAQLAVIVRPTPLAAVREVSRANELMPQKSTFFYPKLATGLFINPLG